MKTKSILTSKTFWMNMIALFLSITVLVDPQLLISIGISPEKQVQAMAWIGAVTAILNKVLRFITNAPVELISSEKKDA